MVVETICTLTAKGQTTVPKAVRQALGLAHGARIAFRIENGIVTLHPVDAPDPALAPFLDLLARDMAHRPEALSPLSPALAARIEALTEGVGGDPATPIEGEVAL